MKAHWFEADLSNHSPVIPLHWASSIMLVFALPLTFYLGKWNIPLWVSFIVWTQYFILGANRGTWRIVAPFFLFGALLAALWCISATFIAGYLKSHFDGLAATYIAFAITNLVWVTIVVHCLGWSPKFGEATLSIFNGFTMMLAVYFTGSSPEIGPVENPYYIILLSAVWAVIAGYIGWCLGWLNVFLTFPREKSL